MLLRLLASPRLSAPQLDDLVQAGAGEGAVLFSAHDSDLNCSTLTAGVEKERLNTAVEALAKRLGPQLAAQRALRFEVLSPQPQETPAAQDLRALAILLHGALQAPVYVASRSVPVAAWALARPMPWGRSGLAVAHADAALPFAQSRCLGIALEAGTPTVILKARLDGIGTERLTNACSAVGGVESGFAEVAAYPVVSAADATAVAVLEFGDLKRSPVYRALAVLEIELARCGARLGETALLSHLPLPAILDVLRTRIGLHVAPAQVLETRLPGTQSRPGVPVSQR
jgi:hypothetical protein